MDSIQPLTNELILRNLFSKLELHDLLICRLVCKRWATDPEILRRLTTEVMITFNKQIGKLMRFVETRQTNTLRVPFKKFSLQYISQKHPVIQEFLEVCGDSIEYLMLTLDQSQMDVSAFRNLLLYRAPNLHTLYIYNLSYNSVYAKKLLTEKLHPKMNLKCLKMQEIRIPITGFLSDFVRIFSNLEEIQLRCDTRSDWEDQARIWKEHSPLATSILEVLLETGSFKRLRIFKCGILDESHIQILAKLGGLGLHLEELEMYCPAKDVFKESLTAFLATQSRSLKRVRFLGNIRKLRRSVGILGMDLQKNTQFALEIPDKMDNLEEMQLSNRVKDQPIPVIPISYARQCPSLKVLVINGCAYNDSVMEVSDYFPDGGLPCLTLRQLALPSKLNDPSILYRIKRLFPNVSSLEIHSPNNAFLRELWKNYGKLERLKFTASSEFNIDSGLTGIPEVTCRELISGGSDDIVEYDVDGGDLDRNGIHNLTGLKYLEITVESEQNEASKAITDLSMNHSLCLMKNLRYLTLVGCCWYDGPIMCNYITQRCQQKLKQILENTCVLFTPIQSSVQIK